MNEPPQLVIGPVRPSDRARVAEVLRSTENFRDGEIDVALELFDASFSGEDYVFLGAFHHRASAGARDQRADGNRESSYELETSSPIPHSPRPPAAGTRPVPDLIGFACYGATPATDRTYDLYWIAVDRNAQGSGCGSRLLVEVERRLEALHARMLVVETSSRSDYTATRTFYVRRGYVEAARVREFYAPADDRIILTKRLAGSPRRGWGAVA